MKKFRSIISIMLAVAMLSLGAVSVSAADYAEDPGYDEPSDGEDGTGGEGGEDGEGGAGSDGSEDSENPETGVALGLTAVVAAAVVAAVSRKRK